MFENISGKLRIWIVVSIVWLLFFLVLGAEAKRDQGPALFVGVLPVIIGWGIWWIRRGCIREGLMKTKFRKILKISLSVIVAYIMVILTIVLVEYLQDEKLLFYATGTQHKAFLNSTWEMSEREIERANNTDLSKELDLSRVDLSGLKPAPSQDKLDFSRVDLFLFDSDPRVLNMSRYKKLIQNHITVFGSDSEVTYSFFDDKLFRYTLSIDSFEADKLQDKMYSNLSERFGKPTRTKEQSKQESRYSRITTWENTDLKVEFWVFDRSLNLRRFTGNVRIIYKPMIDKIQQIALNEEKNLF